MTPGKDFAFSVTALNSRWDCYRFTKDGKRGMMAFRQAEHGKWEVGFFREGEFSPSEIILALQQAQQG
jgi:hypothetical protein